MIAPRALAAAVKKPLRALGLDEAKFDAPW